jgi:hypothetical protein
MTGRAERHDTRQPEAEEAHDGHRASVEEFTLARSGAAAYRPLVERLAHEGVAAVEADQVPIPPDYDRPEVGIAALQERLLEAGHRERTRMALLGGVDGWVDVVAMTRPWGLRLHSSACVSVSSGRQRHRGTG